MHDEMDILREVSSTAAAHGSNALSTMVEKKITLHLPVVGTLAEAETRQFKSDETVVSVQCRILAGLEGKILLTFEEKSAFRLISMCYKKKNEEEPSGVLTEVGLSVLKEIGNIVISSYVGALSMFLKKVVIPSTPTLISGPFGEIIGAMISSTEKEKMVMIETIFEQEEMQIEGKMRLIVTVAAQASIKEACERLLNELHKKK